MASKVVGTIFLHYMKIQLVNSASSPLEQCTHRFNLYPATIDYKMVNIQMDAELASWTSDGLLKTFSVQVAWSAIEQFSIGQFVGSLLLKMESTNKLKLREPFSS